MKHPSQSSIYYLLESFLENPQVLWKPSFGGISIYFQGKLVLSIHENITSTSWKKINYGFPIWYGILIPTEKRNHQILILEIPELQEHPVLKKWLFLKQDNE